MIKVTYKHTPLNFNCLIERNFNTLEEAVRFHATTEKICLYSVEEEGVGYHLVHLNKNNTVAIEPFLLFYMYEGKFREIISNRYSPLPFHISERYKKAIKDIEAEMAIPKLA